MEEALQNRRFPCHGANRSLNLAKTSQLLWAAEGINQPQGKKIAPLGRAVSPLNLYPVVGSGSSPLFWTGNACPWGRVEGTAVSQMGHDFLYGLATIYIVK